MQKWKIFLKPLQLLVFKHQLYRERVYRVLKLIDYYMTMDNDIIIYMSIKCTTMTKDNII